MVLWALRVPEIPRRDLGSDLQPPRAYEAELTKATEVAFLGKAPRAPPKSLKAYRENNEFLKGHMVRTYIYIYIHIYVCIINYSGPGFRSLGLDRRGWGSDSGFRI